MNAQKSYYRTSLCISSKVLSDKEITNILKTKPTKSYEKGTLMSPLNPQSRIRQESSWFFDSEPGEENTFDAHIEQLVFFIEKHLVQFEKLVELCHIEIYCSFFANNSGEEFFLSSKLLKKLTAIPIDFTVALYLPEDDSESE
jgi:hypothetical protein